MSNTPHSPQKSTPRLLGLSKLAIHGSNDVLRFLKQRRDRVRIDLVVLFCRAKLRLEKLHVTRARIEVRGGKCVACDV